MNLRNEVPNSRHKFRIATKNLRYTIEFFQAFYPKRETSRYLGILVALQETFGLSNDRVVAEGFLLQLAADKKALGPSVNFARGFLMAQGNQGDRELWKSLNAMNPKTKSNRGLQ